jgi:hypothetical protein
MEKIFFLKVVGEGGGDRKVMLTLILLVMMYCCSVAYHPYSSTLTYVSDAMAFF